MLMLISFWRRTIGLRRLGAVGLTLLGLGD